MTGVESGHPDDSPLTSVNTAGNVDIDTERGMEPDTVETKVAICSNHDYAEPVRLVATAIKC